MKKVSSKCAKKVVSNRIWKWKFAVIKCNFYNVLFKISKISIIETYCDFVSILSPKCSMTVFTESLKTWSNFYFYTIIKKKKDYVLVYNTRIFVLFFKFFFNGETFGWGVSHVISNNDQASDNSAKYFPAIWHISYIKN